MRWMEGRGLAMVWRGAGRTVGHWIGSAAHPHPQLAHSVTSELVRLSQ